VGKIFRDGKFLDIPMKSMNSREREVARELPGCGAKPPMGTRPQDQVNQGSSTWAPVTRRPHMPRYPSPDAPLGRLYEPLTPLARRIHRQLGVAQKTLWSDSRGYLYIGEPERNRTAAMHSIVGTYCTFASWRMIESDLRLALRERASQWILDWNLPSPRPHPPRDSAPGRAEPKPRIAASPIQAVAA